MRARGQDREFKKLIYEIAKNMCARPDEVMYVSPTRYDEFAMSGKFTDEEMKTFIVVPFLGLPNPQP